MTTPVTDSLNWLGLSQFSPASSAYNRDAVLLFLYTVMHVGASLAYTIIATVIIWRRHYIVNLTSSAFLLFGTLFCIGALHHATSVVIQFAALYRFDVLVLVLVCVQSCATAGLTVLAVLNPEKR